MTRKRHSDVFRLSDVSFNLLHLVHVDAYIIKYFNLLAIRQKLYKIIDCLSYVMNIFVTNEIMAPSKPTCTHNFNG